MYSNNSDTTSIDSVSAVRAVASLYARETGDAKKDCVREVYKFELMSSYFFLEFILVAIIKLPVTDHPIRYMGDEDTVLANRDPIFDMFESGFTLLTLPRYP